VIQKEQIQYHNNQIIWNNENIRYNGKTLFFKLWIKSGFIKIKQLFGKDGKMLDIANLKCKMPNNSGLIMEYLDIINAIPKEWKYMNNPNVNYDNGIYLRSTDGCIDINKTTIKLFRNELIKKDQASPICQQFWQRKYPNFPFEWEKIWNIVPSLTNEGRLLPDKIR
jgi:hypothetical protein